jgi:hypothetical protein
MDKYYIIKTYYMGFTPTIEMSFPDYERANEFCALLNSKEETPRFFVVALV